ncbi:hypothetical protein B0H13DRAFT_1890108 [Mycena leptocephala]|nr:hypothetical protein B0H13DRAFT_1890108 [Mycena leptocephala]
MWGGTGDGMAPWKRLANGSVSIKSDGGGTFSDLGGLGFTLCDFAAARVKSRSFMRKENSSNEGRGGRDGVRTSTINVLVHGREMRLYRKIRLLIEGEGSREDGPGKLAHGNSDRNRSNGPHGSRCGTATVNEIPAGEGKLAQQKHSCFKSASPGIPNRGIIFGIFGNRIVKFDGRPSLKFTNETRVKVSGRKFKEYKRLAYFPEPTAEKIIQGIYS